MASACAAQSVTPALLRPAGVAYDHAGDLFIADANRNQVFEITLAGALTTVAGTGVQGFSGDGGLAAAAQLNAPQGIAVGADGTLYIADTGNERIRAVSGGRITTVAGGVAGFGGDGGPASAARFHGPVALAMDSAGALFVCDRGNQRVREIRDGVITTVAGDGTQGPSGDGGAATAAELNNPSGVAAAEDGTLYIADTGNERVRVVTPDGKIASFAGDGAAGFSGDGGPAVTARLSHPDGLVIDATGGLLVADRDNHRLRRVGPDGMITTVAGSGTQGLSAEGAAAPSAALNLPEAAAFSPFGWPLFSDAANHTLQALLGDGKLYEPAGLASRTTTLSQTTPSALYGEAKTELSAASSAGPPVGSVEVFDGSVDGSAQVGQGALSQGSASLALPTLAAGAHTLTMRYDGDGVHPAATIVASITVSPAPVTASAQSITVSYGATLPVLSGTLSGVLPQDQGKVNAVYSAVAPSLPDAGTYPITAVLSGPASGNYELSMKPGSGSLTVVPAASMATLSPISMAYAGLPLQLTAHVASSTRGVPTGTVRFLDGGTPVATATLVNGVATAVYLEPGSGQHDLTVVYLGDRDFLASESSSMIATVQTMPDFGLTLTGSSQQTVLAGSAATYGLNVASSGAPFTGIVTFSASGLPAGASAVFSPPNVVPGAGSAAVTMTINTSASVAWLPQRSRRLLGVALGLLLLPFFAKRRRRERLVLRGLLLAVTTVVVLGSATGCGARVAPEPALQAKTYAVTVKATSTNLAGGVVVHSVNVTLGVE